MRVPRLRLRDAVVALALIIPHFAATRATAARTPPVGKPNCFFTRQWNGWKSPAPDVVYLGVSIHDVYRVGLAHPSSLLQDPNARIVSVTRGSSSICLPIDLDMNVTTFQGISEHLYPLTLVKLTPEEIKAIPPKYIPY